MSTIPQTYTPLTVGHIETSLIMLFDPGTVNGTQTGNWRALQPGDFISTINFPSGVSVGIDDVAVTGGQISLVGTSNVNVTNALLATSGNSSIVNTPNVVAVGGFLGLTGSSTVSLTGIPGLLTVTNQQYSTVNNSTPSGSLVTIVTGGMAANPARKQLYAQVVGTGAPLYMAFNSNAASATNFNVLLKADSTAFAGNGGVFTDAGNYTGPVMVSGNVGCQFILWQA